MRQKKLVTRLIWNYTLIIVLFTGVMLSLFFILLNNQATNIHREQLKKQGDVIAENIQQEKIDELTLEEDDRSHGQMMHRMRQRGNNNSYLELISLLSTDDIYIVDKEGNPLFTTHMDQKNNQLMTAEAKDILQAVNKEQKPVFVNEKRKDLGYGVPIKDPTGSIYGSVILLSTKSGIVTQTLSDYKLLIWSLLIALLITVIISILMSKRFVKPIHEMGEFTDELIKQNYEENLYITTRDELADLGDKLLILRGRLVTAKKEQDNKEKNQKLFLSQISHELRTPVMVIKNSLEMLRQDFLNEEEQKEHIKQLESETDQLGLLVNDLLELTRLQSTEFSINEEELNVVYVIEDSIRSYRNTLKKKEQEIIFNNFVIEEEVFVGDYQRLLQLMKILIDNASKYSEARENIKIDWIKKKDSYELSVKNRSKQRLFYADNQNVFEAFNQGAGVSKKGHGLGLTIAKQIVRRHNGEILFNLLDEGYQVEVKIIFSF